MTSIQTMTGIQYQRKWRGFMFKGVATFGGRTRIDKAFAARVAIPSALLFSSADAIPDASRFPHRSLSSRFSWSESGAGAASRLSSENNCPRARSSANRGKSSIARKRKAWCARRLARENAARSLDGSSRGSLRRQWRTRPVSRSSSNCSTREEKLSVQVHPPAAVAAELGGEPKTECWYVAHAEPARRTLRRPEKRQLARRDFEAAIENGTVAEQIHRIPSEPATPCFSPAAACMPSARATSSSRSNKTATPLIASSIGTASDPTARRARCTSRNRCARSTFDDFEPELLPRDGRITDQRIRSSTRKVEPRDAPREVARRHFRDRRLRRGEVACAGVQIKPGEFFLVPASLADRVAPSRCAAEHDDSTSDPAGNWKLRYK